MDLKYTAMSEYFYTLPSHPLLSRKKIFFGLLKLGVDLKDVTDGIHIYMLMLNPLQHVSLQLNFKE